MCADRTLDHCLGGDETNSSIELFKHLTHSSCDEKPNAVVATPLADMYLTREAAIDSLEDFPETTYPAIRAQNICWSTVFSNLTLHLLRNLWKKAPYTGLLEKPKSRHGSSVSMVPKQTATALSESDMFVSSGE